MSEEQPQSAPSDPDRQTWREWLAEWGIILCAALLVGNLFKSFRDVSAIRSEVNRLEGEVRQVSSQLSEANRKLDRLAGGKADGGGAAAK